MGRQPLAEKIPEVDQGHNLLGRHVAEKFPHWLFLKFAPQVPKCIDDGGYGKSNDTLQNTSTSSPQPPNSNYVIFYICTSIFLPFQDQSI